MQTIGAFDSLPLWTLFPLTVLVTLVSVELGYRLGRSRRQRSQGETESSVGAIVAATLALLAFMLAFTFGFAASRFEDRRQVVLEEANAIGTTYLRAAMLAEPMSTETRNLLRQYVDVRLEGSQPGKFDQAVAKSEELQNRLWTQATAVAEKDRSPVAALYIESLNEVIDLHAKRIMAAIRSRVPPVIWIALYLLAVLSMAVMGYHDGLTGSRRSLAVIALVLAFSTVLILIQDLDRPGEGLLRISQQSMVDLQKSFSATRSSP